MRSQGRIRKAGGGGGAVRFRPDPKAWGGGGGGGGGAVRFRPGTKSGGGGGVQSASGPIRKVGGGGGGGGACRTMIYIFVCARARDSAWGMERGGGGQLVPEGGISYEWGGGGGRPPPRAYAGSGADINEAMAHLAALDFFGLRYCLIMDPFVQPYVYKNNYKLLIFITYWTMPMDYISW